MPRKHVSNANRRWMGFIPDVTAAVCVISAKKSNGLLDFARKTFGG
jgi:hypothetical protein